MLVMGLFGKVSALFVSIPEPVVGGVFTIMFGSLILVLTLANFLFLRLCCCYVRPLVYSWFISGDFADFTVHA